MQVKDPFKPTKAEEYELARRIGDRRFASDCRHEVVRRGCCVTCLRKVVS